MDLMLDDQKNEKFGALNGAKVAYFCPTYKMLSEVWRELIFNTKPIITSKSESEKRIIFMGGGFIDFWSLDNIDSVRGRKYHRAVIDEASILASQKLKDAWEQSIRPLLTDYKGDAWFLSTPKGKKHYFRQLADNYKTDPERWSFFQMPSISNPFLDPNEVEEAKAILPPIVFAQEYLAEFTDMSSDNLFIYNFDKDRHVPQVPYTMDPRQPIVISIDFNVNPMTAIVCQHDFHFRYIRVIGEYRLLNSDVYDLCEHIKKDYDTRRIIITGDAAGWARSSATKGHKSMYDIIQTELRVNWSQIKTPRGKPMNYVSEKRNLANALFSRHPDFTLSNCPYLVEDILNVECNEYGYMNKTKDTSLTHLLDCLCDYLYSMCKDAIKRPILSNGSIKPQSN
jgi:hypothetical protein